MRRVVTKLIGRLIVMIATIAPVAQAASRFAPPAENLADPSALRSLAATAEKNPADGAAVIDALLEQFSDALTPTFDNGGAGVISVSTWIEALPVANRVALAVECEKRFNETAKNRLAAEQARPEHRAADLYAIARRYPLTSTSAAATLAAAERAADGGDADSAAAMYQIAAERGLRGENPPIESLKKLRTDAYAAAPIVFDAPWYQESTAFASPRCFPAAGEGLMFLSSRKFLLAFKKDSMVAWSYPPAKVANDPDQQQKASEQQKPKLASPFASGRGATYSPAILYGDGGSARIVVAHLLDPNGERVRLRGFRATDGKPLWGSEEIEELKGATFLGPPTVAGRYVFAIAQDKGRGGFALNLCAIDITSGRPIWIAAIGTIKEVKDLKNAAKSAELEDFWQQCRPIVAGDKVFITPNAGCAIAVGRFDGKVRWSRTYATPNVPNKDLRIFFQNHPSDLKLVPPIHRTAILRWSNTPWVAGKVLVIAPQDSSSVAGLDVQTGKTLWENRDAPPATLVGGDGSRAVFCGENVFAVNTQDGKTAWTFGGEGAAKISGPAQVVDRFIYLPTSGGVVTLSVEDGRPAAAPKPANFSDVSKSPAGKTALIGAEAIDALAKPN